MNFFATVGAYVIGLIGNKKAMQIKPVAKTPIVGQKPKDYTVAQSPIIGVDDIYEIAKTLTNQYPELATADPYMAATMAVTEAGGNSPNINLKATRYEPLFHSRYVPNQPASYATSYGPLQVLLQTAVETYNAGFKSVGYPTPQLLKSPVGGLYFGMAYQVRIRNYAKNKGISPTESYIVQSYNGGFGQSNSQTQNHYAKYQRNKAVVNNAIA